MRFFNTTGPINPDRHYYIPPQARIDLGETLRSLDEERFFVLHAPRQTGKTTVLRALQRELNSSGLYRCVSVNIEVAQADRENVGAATRATLDDLAWESAHAVNDRTVEQIWPGILERSGPHAALKRVSSERASANSKPIVLFLDEIDALVGDTLISVLRQLRSGYPDRPGRFPQSSMLCGVRDVRDCRIRSALGGVVLGSGDFNIKAESLRLGDFTEGEARSLLGQHTAQTGHVIADDAVAAFWELTNGPP